MVRSTPIAPKPGPPIVDAGVPLTRSHSAPAAAEHSPQAHPSRSGSRAADVNPPPLNRRAAPAGTAGTLGTLAQRSAMPSVTIRFGAEAPSSDAAAHGPQSPAASAAVQPWAAVAPGVLIGPGAGVGADADADAASADLAAALRELGVQVRSSAHGLWARPTDLASPALNEAFGRRPGSPVVPPLPPRVSVHLNEALNTRLNSALSADRLASALAAGLEAGEKAAYAAAESEGQRWLAWQSLAHRVAEQGMKAGVTAGVKRALSLVGGAAISRELRPLLGAAGITQGGTAAGAKIEQLAPHVLKKASTAAAEAGLRVARGVLDEVPIHDGNAEQRLLTALNRGIESGLKEMARPMISFLLETALRAGLEGDTIKPVWAPDSPHSSRRAEN